jgi:hypothetical protein
VTFLAGEDMDSKRLNEEIGLALRKAADQSVTSSTTLVSDNTFTWALDASTRYAYELFLVYTGSSSGNLNIGWTVPAGAAMAWCATGLDTGLAYKNVANLAAATASTFGAVSTSLGRLAQISGTIQLDTTAGNFTLKWAQATSNASATVMRAGSFGYAYRV